MIVTTTPTVEGRPVEEYLGVVSGEAIMGAKIIEDLIGTVRDVVGGRSAAHEEALRKARGEALRGMVREAERMGASAVVGLDLDYEVLGTRNWMLIVTACGTAVRLQS